MPEEQAEGTPKKRKGLLGFYVGLGVIALLLVGFYFAWTPGLRISDRSVVTYENQFERRRITVPAPLSITIRQTLSAAPDQADKDVGMGLDTRKYLHVGSHTLQVTGDDVILLDDWGVRRWSIVDIEKTLDGILKEDAKRTDN
jgi:hypothetical protein